MEKTKKLAYVALLSACLIAPASSISADVPKEGQYDVHAACSGPLQLLAGVKDHIGGSYLATCMPDAPAGMFFNAVVVQCAGSWTLVSGNYEEHGMCESTDQSGDKFFGVYSKKVRKMARGASPEVLASIKGWISPVNLIGLHGIEWVN
jgi:hypothetical protein